MRTDTRSAGGGHGPLIVARVELRLELREVGWPIAREHDATQTIVLPDPAVVNALARHVLSHGASIWRALVRGAATTMPDDRLFPTAEFPTITPRGVSIGDLEPIAEAHCAGWGITVTVDYIP